MQSIPHPNDALDKIWLQFGPLVAEIFEFENVYARTDPQTPDQPVYYKLTFEPSAGCDRRIEVFRKINFLFFLGGGGGGGLGGGGSDWGLGGSGWM